MGDRNGLSGGGGHEFGLFGFLIGVWWLQAQ